MAFVQCIPKHANSKYGSSTAGTEKSTLVIPRNRSMFQLVIFGVLRGSLPCLNPKGPFKLTLQKAPSQPGAIQLGANFL